MTTYFRAADHLPLRFNAADWFIGRHAREGRAGSIAIIDGEGSITYGQLDDAVRRFASLLREAGARRDERIAFIVPDSAVLPISRRRFRCAARRAPRSSYRIRGGAQSSSDDVLRSSDCLREHAFGDGRRHCGRFQLCSYLDKPHAVVVLRSGVAAEEEVACELRDFVKKSLAPYKCPRTIAFVDELPKTATGKVKRYVLRESRKAKGRPARR